MQQFETAGQSSAWASSQPMPHSRWKLKPDEFQQQPLQRVSAPLNMTPMLLSEVAPPYSDISHGENEFWCSNPELGGNSRDISMATGGLETLLQQLSELVEDQTKIAKKMSSVMLEHRRQYCGAACTPRSRHSSASAVLEEDDHKNAITENDDPGPKEDVDELPKSQQKMPAKSNTLELEAERNSKKGTVKLYGHAMEQQKSTKSEAEAQIPSFRDDPVGACQGHCAKIVSSKAFDPLMGLVILANAVCLGISIDWELQGRDMTVLSALEHMFLGVFIVELLMQVVAHGVRCLLHGWHLFDFLVISGGVITQWVLEPIIPGWQVTNSLKQVLVLRMLRLMKLARALRLVSSFRALWKLTQSFMQCAPTMASAFLIMVMVIYIFACVGVEFIAKGDWSTEEVRDLVRTRFSSLPLTMLSLVQFVTGDSISGLYYPLIVQKPWLCVYFVGLLMAVTLALMNLVTALLVEDAIASARMDEEMEAMYRMNQVRKLMPALTNLYRTLDATSDQSVELDEILNAIRTGIHIPPDLSGIVTEDRVLDLFDAFDMDGDAKLTEDEFVSGMCQVALSGVPIEMTQVLHMVRSCCSQLGRIERHMCQEEEQLADLESKMGRAKK